MTTGLLSPLINGIIKVDQKDHLAVAKAIKYFDITDGQGKVWQCRALPFDKDLIGGQKNIINLKQNVFLRKIPEDCNSQKLDEMFSKIGPVKSAKVSLVPVLKNEQNPNTGKKLTVVDETQPCISAGYGFVCFENEDDAKKVIGSTEFGAIEAIKFSPKDPKEIKRQSNNIYIKNFDQKWDNNKLGELFGKYGKIKSIYLKEDPSNPDRKFAFVCFEDPQNREAGFDAAERAVQELNDKEVDGNKLYVQPALSAIQRQGVILREQQRFKNSKKKCNLFVKNFPATFREEDLRPYFAQHGEIESIKILPTHDGQPSTRAFVCFKQPDMAAHARMRLHG